ncbi:MAG: aminopeptidase P family protein [Candidatus Heimdallarchaeota archaeon]|nr:MAG: aminopeptidase P family protein [Candidatus Heimdallarchaeota archaeon]
MSKNNIFANKLAKLKSHMRKFQIESLIISPGINFRYTFGFMEEPSERLLIGIIEVEGSPKMLVPNFEVDRIKRLTGIKDCRGWEETSDPYGMLSELLTSEEGKKIAIEPKMWFSTYQRIAKKISGKEFISAECIFDPLRSVKDDSEQKFLLKASQKSGDAIVETFNELEVGITEIEVQVLLKEKLLWGTKEKAGALVQFGENSSFPHYSGGEKKLKKNDVVLIDAGGTIKNYWGDITITTVFGKASRRFKEIYDIVYTANERGKEAVIANKLPSEVDSVTREYISNKGYGEYFTHRTGHGIGLEVHEHPYIVGNNQTPLTPGNAFTIEPGIYLPGEFGVRIEDDVIKTETGIQTSKIPRYELIEI